MAETHAAMQSRARSALADTIAKARKEVVNAELAVAAARRRLAALEKAQ